jgi:hypothetical protein
MQFGALLSGSVLSDSPRRRLPPDSFSDWLYSRAVLGGPAGPEFDARVEALGEWARATWEDARAPRPPPFAEPSIAVDRDRFFTGLVLLPDNHRREQLPLDPVLVRYPLWRVAMLIADTGRSEAMAIRLARITASTELDSFDRARAAAVLGYLLAVDPTLSGELRFPCDSLPRLWEDPFGVSVFGVALTKERPQNWAASLADAWVGCDQGDLADAYATIAALGRAVD